MAKDLPALSVLKSTDNLRDDLELTSFDLADADSENYNLEKGQAAGGIFMRVR